MITNVNVKLHIYQKELIKKLTTKPNLRFNDLLLQELESEHMNYHLKQLVDFGFVKKSGAKYDLTDIGKDYSNLMDSETDLIEKQPKTSIIVRGVRKNTKGEVEHLLTRRLRQPFLGKVGGITGKVRFGETLKEAAKRELYEETGLKAKTMKLELIYHLLRKRDDDNVVLDILFYIFFAKDFTGKFIEKTPHQENMWVTKNDLFSKPNFDPYDDLNLEDRMTPKPLKFRETINPAVGY